MACWKKLFQDSDKYEKRCFRLFFNTTWGLWLRLLICPIAIPAIIIQLTLELIGKTLNYLSKLLLLIIRPREFLTEEEEEELDKDD